MEDVGAELSWGGGGGGEAAARRRAAVLVALVGGPRLMGAADRLHVGLDHVGLHTGVLRAWGAGRDCEGLQADPGCPTGLTAAARPHAHPARKTVTPNHPKPFMQEVQPGPSPGARPQPRRTSVLIYLFVWCEGLQGRAVAGAPVGGNLCGGRGRGGEGKGVDIARTRGTAGRSRQGGDGGTRAAVVTRIKAGRVSLCAAAVSRPNQPSSQQQASATTTTNNNALPPSAAAATTTTTTILLLLLLLPSSS
ncbi:hypothetical protein E2C01_058556 [Portunus trituberculatus]|uniref:Uncharacterized protein n=1 Tax=Portunus trituberculatus TaxID=210409 RepID=A0A5B7H5P9_PORTR|nr:hypothetical protein [Portunus trituberculatus]